MKLYQTPAGTWCGNEKDYKAAMRAEGADPKDQSRKLIEVPTSKPELMEFLTFHNVNVINPPQPSAGAPEVTGGGMPPSITPPPPVAPAATTMPSLDQAFTAAPIGQQLRLAVVAIDAAMIKYID